LSTLKTYARRYSIGVQGSIALKISQKVGSIDTNAHCPWKENLILVVDDNGDAICSSKLKRKPGFLSLHLLLLSLYHYILLMVVL
jgi:hypothetical protein